MEYTDKGDLIILVAAIFKAGDKASGGAVRSDAQALTDGYNFVDGAVALAKGINEQNRNTGRLI